MSERTAATRRALILLSIGLGVAIIACAAALAFGVASGDGAAERWQVTSSLSATADVRPSHTDGR